MAASLFRNIRAHRLLLEYDDERSGSFAPLSHVPEDKIVVLGLVGTKNPETPSAKVLLHRLEAAARIVPKERLTAARIVPKERLAISPQCGFSTSIVGNQITTEDQRQKLERVVAAAREFWPSSTV